ncbi:MAG: flagellar basal body-associated FliL family protein [Candidatus Anammoxibacter sp.]
MPIKTLIILAVIAIISVAMAFIVVTKGLIPMGKQDDATVASEDGVKDGEGEPVEGEGDETGNLAGGILGQLPDITVIPLDPVVVNLRGSFGRRYLRVAINLGMEKDARDDLSDEEKNKDEGGGLTVKAIVEGNLVEIRDVLISLLSAKSIEDVDGWADQDVIRNEIKQVLNKELKMENGISKVFFTEFVVQ